MEIPGADLSKVVGTAEDHDEELPPLVDADAVWMPSAKEDAKSEVSSETPQDAKPVETQVTATEQTEPTDAPAPDGTAGHDFDKGLSRFQMEMAMNKRDFDTFKDDVGTKFGQILERLDQTPSPSDNGNGQPAATPTATSDQVIDKAFDSLDIYDSDQLRDTLKTALNTATDRGQPPPNLDHLTERLAKLESELHTTQSDSQWSQWYRDTGLTVEHRDQAFEDASKRIDDRFGYEPGPSRDAAINAEFDHALQAIQDSAAPPKPEAASQNRTPEAPYKPQPTTGTDVIPTGSAATTSVPADVDFAPDIRDEDIFAPD